MANLDNAKQTTIKGKFNFFLMPFARIEPKSFGIGERQSLVAVHVVIVKTVYKGMTMIY